MSFPLSVAIIVFCALILGQFIALHKVSRLKREVATRKKDYDELRRRAVAMSEEVKKVNASIDSNQASIVSLGREIAKLQDRLEKEGAAEDPKREAPSTPAGQAS